MSTLQSTQHPISTTTGFLLGGVAACCAVTFSNPPEVAKTRLQLQGELTKDTAQRVYKNTLDVLLKTAKNEGIRGVQRGLGVAYMYQILVNGSRLSFYEPFRQAFNKLASVHPLEQNGLTSILAGASSGAVGACISNPLFLVKARMQAYSPALPVGTQHNYRNTIDALVNIVRSEGLLGLGRGMNAAVLRTASGSSVQVPSYLWTKDQLVSRKLMDPNSFWTFFTSSCVAGVTILVVMQPTDTVLTRMYNQPVKKLPDGRSVGTLYRNPLDAMVKIMKHEGPLAWYKGSTAHFFRITPHTIITLTANDLIRRSYLKFRDGN